MFVYFENLWEVNTPCAQRFRQTTGVWSQTELKQCQHIQSSGLILPSLSPLSPLSRLLSETQTLSLMLYTKYSRVCCVYSVISVGLQTRLLSECSERFFLNFAIKSKASVGSRVKSFCTIWGLGAGWNVVLKWGNFTALLPDFTCFIVNNLWVLCSRETVSAKMLCKKARSDGRTATYPPAEVRQRWRCPPTPVRLIVCVWGCVCVRLLKVPCFSPRNRGLKVTSVWEAERRGERRAVLL